VGILLPALGKARLAAQSATSAANLGSLARVQAQYAADYKDCFTIPFALPSMPNRPELIALGGGWYSYVDPSSEQGASGTNGVLTNVFGESQRVTELWAWWWATQMTAYISNDAWTSGVTRDPADTWVVQRQKSIDDTVLRNSSNSAQSGYAWQYIDTSYWLSPTLWLAPERYASSTFQQVTVGDQEGNGPTSGKKYLRRQRFDQVSTPSSKSMIFERFDWTTKVKGFPAQFNNPAAKPKVAFVDSSVADTNVGKIYTLINTGPQSVQDVFLPSGTWGQSTGMSRAHFSAAPNVSGPGGGYGIDDPFEDGTNGTFANPQFFWATRNGINGRDVQR
jgi:hypothetical protein